MVKPVAVVSTVDVGSVWDPWNNLNLSDWLASQTIPAYFVVDDCTYSPYQPISTELPEFSSAYLKRGSFTVTVVLSTVVVVPSTVRFPVIVALPAILMFVEVISSEVKVPSTWTLLNWTLSVVPTAWPIDISPDDMPIPVPAVKCALTSDADGPV